MTNLYCCGKTDYSFAHFLLYVVHLLFLLVVLYWLHLGFSSLSAWLNFRFYTTWPASVLVLVMKTTVECGATLILIDHTTPPDQVDGTTPRPYAGSAESSFLLTSPKPNGTSLRCHASYVLREPLWSSNT